MKLLRRKDLIIIAAVALLIIITAAPMLFAAGGAAARVNIYVGGELYDSVAAGRAKTVTIDQGNGKINVVEVTETGVRMLSSTCPNQDCVMKGELSFDGERGPDLLSDWIVCLPNGVSVELARGDK